MKNEKLSLFDLLSFLIPGGTMLYFAYFLVKPFINITDYLPSKNSNYILIPYFFVSYFLGHIISFLGRQLEKRWTGNKNSWIKYLENNASKARELNKFNIKLFEANFYSGEAENEKLDINKTDTFFDSVYYYLESNQKLDKVSILMAQYSFFRNAAALCLLSLFLSIGYTVYGFCNQQVLPIHYVLIVGFIASFLMSIFLMRERKSIMMATVYQIFLAVNYKSINPSNNEKLSK